MAMIRDLAVQYITNEKGKKTGVILAIEEFEALLEDFSDLLIIAERENEETISHEELLAELEEDGKI